VAVTRCHALSRAVTRCHALSWAIEPLKSAAGNGSGLEEVQAAAAGLGACMHISLYGLCACMGPLRQAAAAGCKAALAAVSAGSGNQLLKGCQDCLKAAAA
jgi:hypothetical protein